LTRTAAIDTGFGTVLNAILAREWFFADAIDAIRSNAIRSIFARSTGTRWTWSAAIDARFTCVLHIVFAACPSAFAIYADAWHAIVVRYASNSVAASVRALTTAINGAFDAILHSVRASANVDRGWFIGSCGGQERLRIVFIAVEIQRLVEHVKTKHLERRSHVHP
jgi:hypothetical protein